ncbi:MAG: hypothetical protein LQ340_004430 [Diploschistes diacapsis]|nr:MAG: hypothetical protein LQ340_004430 [Diploschistes diacapsis]
MAENTQPNPVDTTPISTLERRDSLEKHLQTRPDPQDLKDRHILLDTSAAPSLQAAAQELERARATDNLKKGLEKRSDREELVQRNILPDSTAAPALQEKQKSLDKHMRMDSLEQKLQNRPKPDDLVKDGILSSNESPIQE